jgi:CBS domain-containing protein
MRIPRQCRKKIMNAADVMTKRVLTVKFDATLSEAVELMLKNGISGLPVVDGSGALVGMLTEGDLLRRVETGTERKRARWLEFLLGPGKMAAEYVHAHGRKVNEVMSNQAKTVGPATPLEEVVSLMEKQRIKRVPVVEHGRLIGIVSRANLMQALMAVSSVIPPTSASDEEIRARLWTDLEKTEWAPIGLINVIVRDGIVHLHGTITDGRERAALCAAAENVPGVKAVQDHMIWCDYTTGTVIEMPEDEKRAAGGRPAA